VKPLYKYHAYSKFSLTALANKQVWVPKPGTFNDPYDCYATIFQVQTLLRRGNVGALGKRNIGALQRGIKGEDLDADQTTWVRDMGVYCMSACPENRLMWAHYADKFSGFCLEYAFDEATFDDLIKVNYEHPTPSIQQEHNQDSLIRKVSEFKAKDWEYENEFRWVQTEGGRYYDRPAPITAVIFGPRCHPIHRDILKKKLLGPDVEPREVLMDGFELNVEACAT